MSTYPELTEAERFPILSSRGRQLLHRMRQHPNAPVWNWPNGEQLNQVGLAQVMQFAESLRDESQARIATIDEPAWVNAFIERCVKEVPFYRSRSRHCKSLQEIATCCRADMAPRAWDFVPDGQCLDELITFSSSGTTGHPTRTPHHPYSAACGVPLMEHALKSFLGLELLRGVDHIAIGNFVAYPGAYTTAIVVSYLEEAGCIRVNLDPTAWRNIDDRAKFINQWQAPIWLGDPIAFGVLERIDVDYKPKAILSSIMHLSPAYAAHLSNRYACAVLDMYALTEAGIVAVGNSNGHRILAPDLFVEIIDAREQRCAPGVRGEIVLTGGRNPYFPLLRYRTGDYAALQLVDGFRTLVGLEGREPVEYPTLGGKVIHSMEITRIMRKYPVRQYEMKSGGEGNYQLHCHGDVDREALLSDLIGLFGDGIELLVR